MKNIQHSYTSLVTHDQCPEQYRHIYLLKDFKKSYATAQDGIDIHKSMEQRLRYKQPLPEPLTKMEKYVASLEIAGKPEVEVSLAVSKDFKPTGFWEKHTYLRGKFDVIERWPDLGKAFIGDWKSGRVRESSDQLEIGAMLLMAAEPLIETVVGANIWLQKPGPGTPYRFERAALETTWLKWLKRMQAIEHADPAQEWEKREGPLCGYCPVATCQHYRGA